MTKIEHLFERGKTADPVVSTTFSTVPYPSPGIEVRRSTPDL
jgi:hypothetical protein